MPSLRGIFRLCSRRRESNVIGVRCGMLRRLSVVSPPLLVSCDEFRRPVEYPVLPKKFPKFARVLGLEYLRPDFCSFFISLYRLAIIGPARTERSLRLYSHVPAFPYERAGCNDGSGTAIIGSGNRPLNGFYRNRPTSATPLVMRCWQVPFSSRLSPPHSFLVLPRHWLPVREVDLPLLSVSFPSGRDTTF